MSCTDLDRALHKQVVKREAWKESEWREKKDKRDAEVHLGFGATDMCKQELRKIIDGDRRQYYRSEELNDKLYIHYKGWKEINGLEGWTGLKAMYAEYNAFDKIQGLQTCRQLRNLFLSENCIKKIEGLENCTELWSLNLSSNFIEKISGISKLKNLNTLTIAKNKIGFGGVEDLIELVDSPVCALDIQDNKIWDPDVLPEVFSRMPDLRVLYLKGNPCGKKIPNYRKSITVYCEDLRYLDDRPVFPEDRRTADAFNRGGLEEERAEKRRIREENTAKHDKNMRAFQDMIDRVKLEKRERTDMRAEDKFTDETDPVESQEQRLKRQVDRWKEEHADEIKDDPKEYAKRCLKGETAVGGAQDGAVQGNPSPPQGEEALDAKDTPIEAGEGKVDNRTLVYEDIWDDVPPVEASRAAATSAAAGGEPRKAMSFAPPPRGAAASAAPGRQQASPGVTAAASTRQAPADAPPVAGSGADAEQQELDEMD